MLVSGGLYVLMCYPRRLSDAEVAEFGNYIAALLELEWRT
jgi:hypothetical protein